MWAQWVGATRKALKSGDADFAYKFLTDAGVVGSTIVRANEFAATENSEQLSGSDQYFINLLRMAKQRIADFDLPPDTLEMHPTRNARTIVEKTS